MAEQTTTPRVRTDLPPATTEELEQLADLIAEAQECWGVGPATLARAVTNAGYRLVPEPEPLRYGECRACAVTCQVTPDGGVVEHQDRRRKQHCIGSRVTPVRFVDPYTGAGVDG